MKHFEIPISVTYIDDGAFEGCSSLESIIIPNSVTKIGRFSFHSNESLEQIYLPGSLTEIGDDFLGDCKSLKEIQVPLGEADRFRTLLKEHEGKITEVPFPDFSGIRCKIQHDGWIITSARMFTPHDISVVKHAQVVTNQYGKSVCCTMNLGGMLFLNLSVFSNLSVGDSVDLSKAVMITLHKDGMGDIERLYI